MHIKAIYFALTLVLTGGALIACDADGSGENRSEEDDSIKDEWQIAYTGDRTGEIAGTITTHMAMDITVRTTSIAGFSNDSDVTMSAGYHTPLDGPHTGPLYFMAFNMTLDDGSICRQQLQGEDALGYLDVNVLTDNDEAFQLEFSGQVDCDGDVLAVTGTFDHKQ